MPDSGPTSAGSWGHDLIYSSGSMQPQYLLPFLSIAILAVGMVTIAHSPALTDGQKSAWLICNVLLPLAGSLAWIIVLLIH